MKHDRILCFGDSITLAANDSEGLGWPGRLGKGLCCNGRSVAMYNLGINGDTSEHIRDRWQSESCARSRDARPLLLFAFGFNDASERDGGGLQVALEDSVQTARDMLDAARAEHDLLWIGPTPLDESVNPLVTAYASWVTWNSDIRAYDAAYAQLAAELGIDYLPVFDEFVESPRYTSALAAGDGIHPGDDGYAMIAERIAGWPAWQQRIA